MNKALLLHLNFRISIALLVSFFALMLSPLSAAGVLTGEYVLVINTSPNQTQSTGSIVFDPTNNFKSASVQGSNQGFVAQVDGATNPLMGSATATVTYTIGQKKTINSIEYTCIGIGTYSYVWMDAATLAEYDALSKTARAAAEINTLYETKSYPILKQLGAETLLNYADGSGKLSILVSQIASTGYFSSTEMNVAYGGITAIHVLKKAASTYSEGYNIGYAGYSGLFAHEGQHALNYCTSKWATWMNEGLSLVTMDINTQGTDGNGWLTAINPSADIQNGGPLVHSSYLGNTALDYSLPFLFIRYLNAQVNSGFDYSSSFYNEFYRTDRPIGDQDSSFIKRILNKYPNTQNWTFATAMKNFRIACVRQDYTGPYGFYGDPIVAAKVNAYPIYNGVSGTAFNLLPSGAVIIKTVGGSFTVPADCGANIEFIQFNITGSNSPLRLQGTGTAVDPYLIGHAVELENLDKTEYTFKYFKLTNDIDLAGYALSVDSFCGQLDGANYKIKNINTSFIKTNKGTIKNLFIDINAETSYGFGFVDYNYGTITDCSVSGNLNISLNVDYQYFVRYAGLVGWNYAGGSILRCSSTLNITGHVVGNQTYVAGLCAYFNGGTMTDCYAAGSINLAASAYAVSYVRVGGVAGKLAGTYSNLYGVTDITVAGTGLTRGRVAGYMPSAPAATSLYGLTGMDCIGSYTSYVSGLKSGAQLQSAATFPTFDFVSVWKMPTSGTYLYPMFPREIAATATALEPSVKDTGIKSWVAGSEILVEGASEQLINIYNSMGTSIVSAKAKGSAQSFTMPISGVYIVQVGDYHAKLLVK